jgi:hypothetical protein
MSYTLSIDRRRTAPAQVKDVASAVPTSTGAAAFVSEGAQCGFVERPTPLNVDIADENGRPYASRAAEKSAASNRSVFGDVRFANLV